MEGAPTSTQHYWLTKAHGVNMRLAGWVQGWGVIWPCVRVDRVFSCMVSLCPLLVASLSSFCEGSQDDGSDCCIVWGVF